MLRLLLLLQVHANQVHYLPGWNKALKSKIFAGYVELEKEMFEHYMLFESEGQPDKDPLIVWMNGGPGASSLFGAFTELGPYRLSAESLRTSEYQRTGVPTLFDNDRSWTRLGSLLVLNAPPPVGFSYCDPAGPPGDGYSCGNWTDERAADMNALFLERILHQYPWLSTLDIYITGESYAGIYIPMMVERLKHKVAGVAIGDGCIGNSPCMCLQNCGKIFDVEFLYGHGQFSRITRDRISQKCTVEELRDGHESPACRSALNDMNAEVGGFFTYDLYDECFDFDLRWLRRPLSPASAGGYPCGGSHALRLWVVSPQVKSALHVSQDAAFFMGDNGVGFPYAFTVSDVIQTLKKVAEAGTRVLLYNGDADPSLNSFHAQNWTTYGLNYAIKQGWRPWTLDGKQKMAGHVVRYDHGVDFATIRGAGHMVPLYKPDAAYTLVSSWLKKKNYPSYAPNASQARLFEDEYNLLSSSLLQ